MFEWWVRDHLVGDVLPLPPPSWWLGLCVSMDLSLEVSLNTKTKLMLDAEVNDEVDRSYNVVFWSSSTHDQNTSWVIVGYPGGRILLNVLFYVFLRRWIMSEQETMRVEQDNGEGEGTSWPVSWKTYLCKDQESCDNSYRLSKVGQRLHRYSNRKNVYIFVDH